MKLKTGILALEVGYAVCEPCWAGQYSEEAALPSSCRGRLESSAFDDDLLCGTDLINVPSSVVVP